MFDHSCNYYLNCAWQYEKETDAMQDEIRQLRTELEYHR